MSLRICGATFGGVERVTRSTLMGAAQIIVSRNDSAQYGETRHWTLERGIVTTETHPFSADRRYVRIGWHVVLGDLRVPIDGLRLGSEHYAAIDVESVLVRNIDTALRARFPQMPYTVPIAWQRGEAYVRPRTTNTDGWYGDVDGGWHALSGDDQTELAHLRDAGVVRLTNTTEHPTRRTPRGAPHA